MNTLYTLGYLAWTPPAVVQCVQDLGAVVTDIRFSPTSRHPAWRQATLRRTLGECYRHIGALGNRHYKGGPVELVDLEAGLTTLAEFLEASPVILLCACAVVDGCHRRLVAEAYAARYAMPITHLTPPASAATQLALFRDPETPRRH
jgi:uncharacterized protein (DUF488 family)